jgi:ribose transport system permease protein
MSPNPPDLRERTTVQNVETSADQPGSSPASSAVKRPSFASRFLERYVVILALIAIIIVFSIVKSATFPTTGNLDSVLTTQSVLLIVSLSLTVVLSAGDLDLSIGGMIGFSSIWVADLMSVHGMGWPLALVLSLLVAIAVGAVNGFLIVGIRVNPLISTLAMGTLLDGLGSAVSNASTIGELPVGFTNFFGDRWLGIGLPFWFALILLAILAFVFYQLPMGRRLYFTGEGRESARLIGIRVTRVRVIALIVSAVGAWFAGIVLVGQTGAAQSGFGDPYVLPAYASAFLGAATIMPGRFNPIGTLVGVLLLAVGTNGLQLFGLATWVTQVFDGGILIVAVAAAALLGRARARE